MTAPATRLLTDALLTALRAAHPRVGDAIAPDDTTYPYAVLYPAGIGSTSGPVSDANADSTPLYQITCVGKVREEAEWLSDLLRPVALGALTVTGWKVADPRVETSQPVRRDDSTAPPVFYAADQIRYFLTPA